jgi:hypothetical protein
MKVLLQKALNDKNARTAEKLSASLLSTAEELWNPWQG